MKNIAEAISEEVTTNVEVSVTAREVLAASDIDPEAVTDDEGLSVEHTETRLTDDTVETLSGWLDDEFLQSCDRETVTTYLDTVLLLLILVRGRASGKELRQDIRRVFDVDLSSGTVYPHLTELEDDGKLASHELKRQKVYTVADGETVFEHVNRRVNQVATFSLALKGLLAGSRVAADQCPAVGDGGRQGGDR
jgi:Transcriptional regulator PadR-like family.